MQRGSIVLTKFPFTDLTSAKRRPGIIVSAKTSNTNDVIIAFISSVVYPNPEATDYLIPTHHKDFLVSGLKKASLIKLDKLATINLSLITGEIGNLSSATMADIDGCLKRALGLN